MAGICELREGVTFDLADGWVELPARPESLADGGWQRWRAALGLGGEPSFAWMEGLVPPETQALSEAYAKKVSAEAAKARKKSKRREDPASLPPLPEIADYLRAGAKIAPLRVFGSTSDATLLFVFVITTRGADAMRPSIDRVIRWSGLRVDGGGSGEDLSLVGDSFGTMDWGLGSAEIRAYPAGGIVVFGAAPSYEALAAAQARLHVPQAIVEADLRKLPPDGRRARPKPGMRELDRLVTEAALSTTIYFPIRGRLSESLVLGTTFGEGDRGERAPWNANGHAFADVDHLAGYVEQLAEAGMKIDPVGARLLVYGEADRADHLVLHTAWTSAVSELLEPDPPAADALTIACTSEWGVSFATPTMAMTKVVRRVPVGAVVLDKRRSGADVWTEYYVAAKSGLQRLADKDAASAKLAAMFVAGARESGRWPSHATPGRSFKNGNVEVLFEPTKYDRFPLRITEALAGEPPAGLIARLTAPAPVAKAKAKVDDTWISEEAKSNRSTCRTCGEPIEKGTLRRGEPHDYQGSVSYRWHHDACVGPKS